MPTLTDLKVDFVSIVDRAAVRDHVQQAEPARFLVWKRDDHTPSPTPPPDNGGEDSMTPEEQAKLDKAQADLAAANATIETQKAENDALKAAAPAPVEKADEKVDLSKADPATRAYIEKMEADRAADRVRAEKAEKDANEANEIAKAERDTRITREFVTKAESYKALTVEPAKFGPVLKSASEKLTKDEYTELERVLKAADEQIATSGLFKEHGRSREGRAPDSAIAEATQKAEELRKSDPTLTPAAALDKAFDADQALAERYLAETR